MELAPIVTLIDDVIFTIMVATGDLRWAYNLSCTCRRMAAAYRARWKLLRDAFLCHIDGSWTVKNSLAAHGPFDTGSKRGFVGFHGFEGPVITTWREGCIEQCYKHDRPHGHRRLRRGTEVLSETMWRNGEMDGPCFIEMPATGRRLELMYEAGAKHGDFIDHMPTGYIVAGTYSRNEFHGALSMISPDGELAWRRRYDRGVLLASMTYQQDAPTFERWSCKLWQSDGCAVANDAVKEALDRFLNHELNIIRRGH